MGNVLFIFSFIAAGILVGIFLRRYPKITFIGRITSICIFFLLFFLGKSVGKDHTIMGNLGAIGVRAFLITFAAIAGSVLVSWFVYNRFLKKDMEGEPSDIKENKSLDESAK